jgi:hypothetical protein
MARQASPLWTGWSVAVVFSISCDTFDRPRPAEPVSSTVESKRELVTGNPNLPCHTTIAAYASDPENGLTLSGAAMGVTGGKWQADTRGGRIFLKDGGCAWEVWGNTLAKYETLGYQASYLGWPITRTFQITSSTWLQYFENGFIADYLRPDSSSAQKDFDLRFRRLNFVRARGTHNSYEKAENLFDQLAFHDVAQVELDLRNGGWPTDPTVYHATLGSNCSPLSKCLRILDGYHRAIPNHEVVLVLLDVDKAAGGAMGFAWTNLLTPAAFDTLINRYIGEGNIYKQTDLLAGVGYDGTNCDRNSSQRPWGPGVTAPNSKDAIEKCGWPVLDQLRGKFIFAFTGPDQTQVYYQNNSSKKLVFKMITTIHDAVACNEPYGPDCNDPDQADVIFYNLGAAHNGFAGGILARGYMTRCYGSDGGLDNMEYSGAINYHCHLLSVDDPQIWSTPSSSLDSPLGYPFETFAVIDFQQNGAKDQGLPPTWNTTLTPSQANVVTVDALTGDIWGYDDAFHYSYQSFGSGAAANNTWTASVAEFGSSSFPVVGNATTQVWQWARGCLMARASTASNSPYVAVCRNADVIGIHAQWRGPVLSESAPATGCGPLTNTNCISYLDASKSEEVDWHDGSPASQCEYCVSRDTPAFLKLEVYNGGNCVRAYGGVYAPTCEPPGPPSPCGVAADVQYVLLKDICLTQNLALQGITGSSELATVSQQHVFYNLKRTNSGVSNEICLPELTQTLVLPPGVTGKSGKAYPNRFRARSTHSAEANSGVVSNFESAPSMVWRGQSFSSSGWLADWDYGTVVPKAALFVDGAFLACPATGLSRSDVAATYGRNDFTKSGWSHTAVMPSLASGPHTLELRTYDGQGLTYGAGSRTIQVACGTITECATGNYCGSDGLCAPGTGWYPPQMLSSAVLTSAPSVMTWAPTPGYEFHNDVYFRGTDGALQHTSSTNGGATWGAVDNQGGGLTDNPSCTSWGAGRVDCVVRGTDNAIYYKSYNNGWAGYRQLTGANVTTSAPTIASWGVNRLDLFYRGNDGAMWTMWSVDGGSTWGGPASHGGGILGAPACVSWGPGRIDCVVRGTDSALYYKYYDQNAWLGYLQIPGTVGGATSAPSITSWQNGRLDVFWRGTDNALKHLWSTGFSNGGATWSGVESLGGSMADAPGCVARYTAGAYRIDCYWRGLADNRLYRKTFHWTTAKQVGWDGVNVRCAVDSDCYTGYKCAYGICGCNIAYPCGTTCCSSGSRAVGTCAGSNSFPSASACGAAGTTCQVCSGATNSCNSAQQCVCTGCVSSGVCYFPSTGQACNARCGNNGSACQNCSASGEICSNYGSCQCPPQNCARGFFWDPSTCRCESAQ